MSDGGEIAAAHRFEGALDLTLAPVASPLKRSLQPSPLEAGPGETLDAICGGRVEILQSEAGYRFNLDPILLAHFAAEVEHPGRRLIDLGTGSGIIPLILARKFGATALTALELQQGLFSLAERNVRRNGCEAAIRLVLGDLRHVKETFRHGAFEVVTCNPPFGKSAHGKLNPNEERAIARHEVSVRLKDLAAAAAHLLVERGSLAVIYPATRLAEAIACFREHALEPKRLRVVHPRAGQAANRVLIEAVKRGRPGAMVLPPLVLHGERGPGFSDEVNAMLS